jgi:hypothetical protein
MLTSCVVFFHDNVIPHTATRIRGVRGHFNWELFDHLFYSPDLAPSDYHLFIYRKHRLRSQRFNNNEELMEGVKMWLTSQTTDFFGTGKQNSIPRHDKCLNSGGDYIDK